MTELIAFVVSLVDWVFSLMVLSGAALVFVFAMIRLFTAVKTRIGRTGHKAFN